MESEGRDKIKRIRNKCIKVQAVLEMDGLFRNDERTATTNDTVTDNGKFMHHFSIQK